MVVRDTEASEETHCFMLLPNRSMSWPAMRNLFLALFACLVGVTLYFGLQGAWLVLPFAGLEIFAVGVAVGYTIRRSADCEIISIQDAEVTVTKTNGSKSSQSTFPRYWTRVCLERGTDRLRRDRLVLGSHGRFVEIGASDRNNRIKHKLLE